jgi:nitrate reductase NapE component
VERQTKLFARHQALLSLLLLAIILLPQLAVALLGLTQAEAVVLVVFVKP